VSDLVLTATDQRNVQAAIRSMLVCAPHKTLNQWRLANHHALRLVIDGDTAFSYLGFNPFEALVSEEISRIGEFPERVSPLVSRFNAFERSERLGAWNRSMLWGEHIGDFWRSNYYQDFARPLRALDGVGLSVAVGDIHAGLQIHRDSIRAGGFGSRDIALLQLLLPAFQVAVGIATSYFGVARESVTRMPQVDRIPATGDSSRHTARHRTLLTHRELEVVRLLAARRSNYEIAEMLHVSRATAKRHTENILQKLGLHSRREVERVIGEV
jgi:DNA-binding CsgD family transcriptional regulator